jgi:hypothetical protein
LPSTRPPDKNAGALIRASCFGFAALLALGTSGCRAGLDMASAYDAERPALTIPYTGVREELRQYPDYGPIGASILTEEKPDPKRGAPPKKGRP